MCFSPRRIPKHLLLEQPRRSSFLQRHWVKLVGYTTFLLLGLAVSDLVQADTTIADFTQGKEDVLLVACYYFEGVEIDLYNRRTNTPERYQF